jgi:hypothetical protein
MEVSDQLNNETILASAEKDPHYPLNRRLGGSQSKKQRTGVKPLAPAGYATRILLSNLSVCLSIPAPQYR